MHIRIQSGWSLLFALQIERMRGYLLKGGWMRE